MYLLKSTVVRHLFKGVLVCLLCSSSALSSPWISVGETRLKQNLHLLNDTGVISMSLTTWPIMWSDVQSALVKLDKSQLNKTQVMAMKELEFEMRFQTKKTMKRSLELAASSSRTVFRDFSGQEFEKGRISHIFDWDGDDLSFKLQANLTTDPGEDAFESQLYGSYFAGVLGNWVLGVGAIDRWWGASTQSSLILGNNSRPVPGVFLRTKGAQKFETPWLSWLGDWQFVSFIGQLENNRHIPEAKLTGMRFNFQPFDGFEIGLSRAMQWGGEGRSESVSTFFKSLTSQGENTTEQAGNQLAGYDFRYAFLRRSSFGMAIYAQMIGEDEAGYLPSKFLAQFGVESNVSFASGNNANMFIELTNTKAGAFGNSTPNAAYAHSVYQSGYRYRGRSLGATYDNDAKVLSSGVSYQFFEASQKVSGVLSRIELNTDDSAGSNTVSSAALDLYSIDLSYQRILFEGKLDISANYLTQLPDLLVDDVDKFNLGIAWTYRF